MRAQEREEHQVHRPCPEVDGQSNVLGMRMPLVLGNPVLTSDYYWVTRVLLEPLYDVV